MVSRWIIIPWPQWWTKPIFNWTNSHLMNQISLVGFAFMSTHWQTKAPSTPGQVYFLIFHSQMRAPDNLVDIRVLDSDLLLLPQNNSSGVQWQPHPSSIRQTLAQLHIISEWECNCVDKDAQWWLIFCARYGGIPRLELSRLSVVVGDWFG